MDTDTKVPQKNQSESRTKTNSGIAVVTAKHTCSVSRIRHVEVLTHSEVSLRCQNPENVSYEDYKKYIVCCVEAT